jgi:hypothetical protein
VVDTFATVVAGDAAPEAAVKRAAQYCKTRWHCSRKVSVVANNPRM